MKIWIIHQHAIPPMGMGPTRHFDLAKKLIAQGHEVYILAGNYCHNSFYYIAEPYSKTKKINYHAKVPFIWFAVPAYKKNSFKRLLNMIVFAYKVVASKDLQYLPKPDVVLGSSPSPFAALAAQKIASRFKAAFIYEIRDLWPETLISLGSFSKRHLLTRILQRIENYLISKSDKIISVLPGVKDYLAIKNISEEKIKWLPNAVDLNDIMHKPLVPHKKISILYAGSFNISNDVETLLRAAKILQQHDRKKFQIKLIGDGPQKSKLQEIIKAENIEIVEFFPTVGKDKIYDIISEADICVAMVKKSNLYRWGTSLNKITDYLAMARPIVFALDSPYSPITEANAGYTIEPENPQILADTILKIVALTTEQREQLGLNGRRFAEQNFNIDGIAISFINHINSS